MLFQTFSNIDIQFTGKKLFQRFYTFIKILPTIKQIELIDKNKFTKVALNKKIKFCVIYMISFGIYLLWEIK